MRQRRAVQKDMIAWHVQTWRQMSAVNSKTNPEQVRKTWVVLKRIIEVEHVLAHASQSILASAASYHRVQTENCTVEQAAHGREEDTGRH